MIEVRRAIDPSDLVCHTSFEMNPRPRKVVVFGLVVLGFLAPLKFSQPSILLMRFPWPGSLEEWLLASWPLAVLYFLLLLLIVFAAFTGVFRRLPWHVWAFPWVFLTWQGISTLASVDPLLSLETLEFWFALAGGFVLGAAALRDAEDLKVLAMGWVVASIFVFWAGFDQANGGLEETRRFLRENPYWLRATPALKEKMESDRIFSTFVNPNALGGFVASAVFMAAAWAVSFGKKRCWTVFAATLLAAGLLYCLWKSQSKGAYLSLFLALGMVFMGLSSSWCWKKQIGGVVLCCALAVGGFALGYGRSGMEKGFKTWEARQSYWRAALHIGADHPLVGSGPGTFARMYPKYKRDADEATKLVHNNYLQMGSDSGFLGFLSFLIWLPGILLIWWQQNAGIALRERKIQWMIWGACAAFAFHSCVDFNLYLPGNAWPIFVLLGFLSREIRVSLFFQKRA